ncbi:unnamed protein product [Toxocara canis]|uniref:MFS domain-containing protein n=1 Tax=Toxocara canis TaxID=6265 RepID=A0A183U1R7_TOXCA|nr:unnamed protein product [Toxocara canis]
MVLLISSITAIIFGAIGSFSGSLLSLTAWRVITGFFAGGEVIVIMVYNMEVTPKLHRLWISTLTTFSPNFMIMGVVAYYSYDWRTFARAISIISLPVIPLVYFSLESPRWLFQKGKVDELRKALRRIRGKKCEDEKTEMELEEMLQESKRVANSKENAKQHYAYHLFYTWQLFTYSCVIGIGMFVTSVINYGLLFNMESLSGSIYLNSVFFGLFRWVLNIGAGAVDYFIKSAGRKVLHFFSVGFIAVCITINFFVFAFELHEYDFLIRYCALAAAAMCAQLYLTKTLAMVELYPTAIRNIATSTMGILSRIGNTLAPQLFYLVGTPYKTYIFLDRFLKL